MTEKPNPRVLIIGGGIAGMEAVLALHHLAPDAAQVTLVSAEPEFHFKPMVVAEPFTREPVERHELAPALRELDTEFIQGAVVEVDPEEQMVKLADATLLSYDYLLVALGGRARPAFSVAETFWAGRGDIDIDGLLEAAASHPSRTLAFVIPRGCTWPLPLYELALMTQRRLEQGGPYGVRLLIVTHEDSPLAIFGEPATGAIGALLRGRRIEVEPMKAVVEEHGALHMHPGGSALSAGAVIALPEIVGPGVAGLPSDEAGFLPVDLHQRVHNVHDVYAAGDGTTFPVKQGGLATQQADVAAEHIAKRLGAAVSAPPFEPVLRGRLITGPDTLNMEHDLTGGHGEGAATLDYLWWPPGKVAGRYLAPWLTGTSLEHDLEPPTRPLDVEVSLPHEWHGRPMAMGSYPNPTR
jgi:sulfide:quinone oxidoreductase